MSAVIEKVQDPLAFIASPRRYYLSGPMSGVEDFNFPAFHAASADLKERGFDIVNPAELDEQEAIEPGFRTWGDYLARDVKIIADLGVIGIVFLPGWSRSRGARLEAQVGLSVRENDIGCPFTFWDYRGREESLRELHRDDVAWIIYNFADVL